MLSKSDPIIAPLKGNASSAAPTTSFLLTEMVEERLDGRLSEFIREEKETKMVSKIFYDCFLIF